MSNNTNEHAHHHHPAPSSYGLAFGVGIGLNLAFVAIEAGYGLWAGSLALVADAGHNLSDVFSLALAWGAHWLSGRARSAQRTYGYKKATILASLVSGLLLLVALGLIAWEAVGRLFSSNLSDVNSLTVMIVAAIGVVINTATALLFMRGQEKDLNIRGAFLHMAADAGVSLGVVIGGLVIRQTGWQVVDPIISLIIVGVILVGTWNLLKESLRLTLDSVPQNINVEKIDQYLKTIPGVISVHDLHIWALSTTQNALTVHLVLCDLPKDNQLVFAIQEELIHEFEIDHATIQIELDGGGGCALED